MNAIILAGGKGSRLQPWHAPKCLLPINGVTILQRLLSHLFSGDEIDRVVVCAGYRASDIEASLNAHVWDGASSNVLTSNAGEDAPMGERLRKARELTDGGRVIICYGDELVDVNIEALLQAHNCASLASLTFVAAKSSTPGGTVVEDPYEENAGSRSVIVEDQARWVNVGFAIVEPECWQWLKPEDGLSDWINTISRERVGGGARVFYFEGKRATVNSLADLQHAEEVWK
ncbi:MAG: NTP transferase domain-containing protein [Gemmatimonadota bacterium]